MTSADSEDFIPIIIPAPGTPESKTKANVCGWDCDHVHTDKPGLLQPGTPERPRYYKSQEDSAATQLWSIRVDEGWRDTIVCSGMYGWAADWLLEQLASRPRYGRPS